MDCPWQTNKFHLHWIEKNYYTEAFVWIERRRWLLKNTLILGDGTWIHLSQEMGLGYIYPRRWDLDTSIPGDGTWIHLSQEMGLKGYIYPRRWDLKDTSIPGDGTWRIQVHLSEEMGFERYIYSRRWDLLDAVINWAVLRIAHLIALREELPVKSYLLWCVV